MSAEELDSNETLLRIAPKWTKQRPCHAVLLARLRQRPCADGPVGSAATAAKSVKAALEGGHKIGCKRKGAWISRCSTSRIAKSLMIVDNEPKHGGVAEPIRRIYEVTNEKGKDYQLKLCGFFMEEMC
jgi:hypothetical protein